MIARYDASHREGAARLWQQVFGDDPRYIYYFLDHLPGVGAVAIEDGSVAAMAFVLTKIRCCGREWGYLYAVATDPGHRGKGLGQAISRAAADFAEVDAICTLPADESLREWYHRTLRLDSSLFIREETILPHKTTEPIQLTAAEYASLREQLLNDMPHAVFPPSHFELLDQLCCVGSGGLFRIGQTILAADCYDGICYIREALGEDTQTGAASLAGWLGARKALLRIPAEDGIPYLSCPSGILPDGTVWNLTLD